MNDLVLQIIYYLIVALLMLIFIRAILSWFPIGYNPITTFIIQATEPMLAPIRRVMPRMGFMDLTPTIASIILFILLEVIQSIR